jgi:galactokinase
VNLIGEHTDYNGGFVLPIATPQRTFVDLTPREDHVVRVTSRNAPDRSTTEYVLGREERRGRWSDYVQAVTDALARRRMTIGGFDAAIHSEVPLGAGLSSSAALEVALLRAISAAFNLQLDAVTIARVAHDAETGLVGAPVGIMDQMAASLADESTALFIDTRSLEFERLALPRNTALVVIDSGIKHSHAGGEYRVRRGECEAAASRLDAALLRDVTPDAVAAAMLPSPLDRRARHVVSENARVLSARASLLAGDAARFGRLMNESHASMRDDFEVSTREVDALVAFAQQEPGVFGARLTGGGFGGAIVALAVHDRARAIADRVADRYHTELKQEATVLIPR